MSPAQPDWQEGDRCTGCGHWWWDGTTVALGGWHSLAPFEFVVSDAVTRPVQCGVCPQTVGYPGVWQ